ncbi:type IX secretion system membrane protein PorP/SprF [Crocinitomicaceae bacterium]|nr:type IX secretion system membrane protein PorP/SprF [Crocinitomicaceae bacterium]
MRLICTSIFILCSYFLFGQETVPNQFWNNFSHFNPAFAGLQYKRQAGLQYEGFRSGNSQKDYQAFYNQRLKKNFGIGFNGNHMTSWNDQTTEISIPISYDWNVKGKHHVAVGVAPSFRNHITVGYVLDTTQAGTIYITNTDVPFRRNYLQTHAGITYKRGNLYAGFGIRNLQIQSAGDAELGEWEPHYYGNISVEMPIGNRTQYNVRHKLILSGLYTYVDGFNRIDVNARAQWENGLNVFVGGRVRGGWTTGAGWDFFQKLRFLYSVSWQRSKLSSSNSVSHEISVVYHLPFED